MGTAPPLAILRRAGAKERNGADLPKGRYGSRDELGLLWEMDHPVRAPKAGSRAVAA